MFKNRSLLFFSSTIVLLLCAGVIFFNQNKPGFSLSKIHSSLHPSPQWEIVPLSSWEQKELETILSQDFNYLGSGAQCYAFISADGNYVLKFFKMKHLIPKNWLKLIPFPGLDKYRFRKIDKRISRQKALFSSYKMAYENLKEETGLVYIHLNQTKDLKIKAKLYDRMHQCFVAQLDDYEFIVQKKAQLMRNRLIHLMQNKDIEGAQKAIRALFKQVVSQCQKGYIDNDSGISNNYGFVGQQVIHFDAGRIMQDDDAKQPSHYQREILRVGKKLESWIEENYPSLLPALDEEITSVMDLSSQN